MNKIIEFKTLKGVCSGKCGGHCLMTKKGIKCEEKNCPVFNNLKDAKENIKL